MNRPVHIIFAGLPATGKTTIARGVASALRCVYLRIDTLEQTLAARGGFDVDRLGPAGYYSGAAIASDNLKIGMGVVSDSVNPWPMTRALWIDAAQGTDARTVCVETFCSDPAEHRRRVETRQADIPGLRLPTWNEVLTRDYQPWTTADLRVDTCTVSVEKAVRTIADRVRDVLG